MSKNHIEDKSQTLYEFLYKEATLRGMSLSHMAHEIGLHHKTLTNTKQSKPRISSMSKISNYLDVNLLDLNLLPIKKRREDE